MSKPLTQEMHLHFSAFHIQASYTGKASLLLFLHPINIGEYWKIALYCRAQHALCLLSYGIPSTTEGVLKFYVLSLLSSWHLNLQDPFLTLQQLSANSVGSISGLGFLNHNTMRHSSLAPSSDDFLTGGRGKSLQKNREEREW